MAAEGAASSDGAAAHYCASDLCYKPATMQCPSCLEAGMPPSFFCSKECFKRSWKEHNRTHKEFKEFQPWRIRYTGPLRPHYVTPMRSVPDHIRKPEYALTGEPRMEDQSRFQSRPPIHNAEQMQGIRAACRLGREVLDFAHTLVRPGVTTEEIDREVHRFTVMRGAYPSPLNYRGFPKACCTSVNEVICHGIPDCRPLQEGDIVNVDISVYFNGYHADLNETFCVGRVEDKYKQLIKVTHDAMMKAIAVCRPNALIRDVGRAISDHVRPFKFGVVRTYCGHGIGELFHCAPNVPHYNNARNMEIMVPGMVFTIEPMVNMGPYEDETWPDDWTSVTVDGSRSAQFEHQVLITADGAEILTARTKDSPPLWWEEKDAAPLAELLATPLGAQPPKPQEQAAPAPAQAASAAASEKAKAKKKKKKKRAKGAKKPVPAVPGGGDGNAGGDANGDGESEEDEADGDAGGSAQ